MGRMQRVTEGGSFLATIAWLAAALVSAGSAGCSLVVDSNANQCSSDTDCASFDGRPVCLSGICVTGVGPPGCFSGTKSTQMDYLNACTSSSYESYSNCDNIGYRCSNGMGSAKMPDTVAPMTGMVGSMVVPPDPSNLRTDLAPTDNGTPQMVWMYGSSDFGPLLKAVQPALSALAKPYRAVFQGSSSCNGVTSVFVPGGSVKMLDPKPAASGGNGNWAYYFDDQGRQTFCRIEPTTTTPEGRIPDIGVSNLYAKTCNTTYEPGTTVGDYLGPVVPFVLAVKKGSAQQAISAEAARLVFGNGGRPPAGIGMKDATPWTDYRNYYIRNSGAGSTVLTSYVIDVPKDKFWGIDRVTTDNLRDGLLAAPDSSTSAAIGILSIDFYDQNRGNLKALYLQSKDQKAGFLPDSQPTTFDKRNVRDGHYTLWGYVHLFAALDSNGGLMSPAAKALVLLLTVPQIEQKLLDKIIDASLTPQCAMQVSRTTEVGPFSIRQGTQCGCYFDARKTGRTDCQMCTTAEDCPGKHPCRYGYCEQNDNL